MMNKAYGMIGMAMKAGKVKSGEFSCEEAIKGRKAKLCIVAADASDNTKKNFSDSCKFYKVEYKEYGTKEDLGRCIGKEMRASICVLDENFAKSIISKMSE